MIRVIELPGEFDPQMGLRGVHAPMFFCDVCESHLYMAGNYCYDMNALPAAILTVCKGQCTAVAEKRIRANRGFFGWNEMSLLLTALDTNFKHRIGEILNSP